jgi:hypothetical protein
MNHECSRVKMDNLKVLRNSEILDQTSNGGFSILISEIKIEAAYSSKRLIHNQNTTRRKSTW